MALDKRFQAKEIQPEWLLLKSGAYKLSETNAIDFTKERRIEWT